MSREGSLQERRAPGLVLFGKKVFVGDVVGDRRWELLVSNLDQLGFWHGDPAVVFVDFRLNVGNVILLLRRRREIRVLVQVEPRSVNPWQFSWLSRILFSHFICDADFSYRFPVAREWRPGFDVDFSRPLDSNRAARAGMLAGNKFSFVEGSQYGLRKKVLNKIQAEGYEVVLGGRGWRSPFWLRFAKGFVEFLRPMASGVSYLGPSGFLSQLASVRHIPYLGEFEMSHEFWESVDFAVVVENERGVMSEKLFEAASAGCGIVYAGTTLSASPFSLHLGDNLDLGNFRELIERFPRDYEEVRRVNAQWLADHIPSSAAAFENLAEQIMELINGQSGPQ